MKKIFVDTDVILDLLQKRKNFYTDAAELFSLFERKKVRGYVSPLIFSNLYYILRKVRGAQIAREALLRLKMVVDILPVGEKTIELALSSPFKDFEDAVQYYCALGNRCDSLITRNKRDYPLNDLPVCLPGEFLREYRI